MTHHEIKAAPRAGEADPALAPPLVDAVPVEAREVARAAGVASTGREVVLLEFRRPLIPVAFEDGNILVAHGLTGRSLEHFVAVDRFLALVKEPDRLKTAVFNLELDPDVLVQHGAPPCFKSKEQQYIISQNPSFVKGGG